MDTGKTVADTTSQESMLRRFNGLIQFGLSWGRQLHKYALVGAAVFALDLVAYWVLMKVAGSWYLHAHFISRTIGGVACFGLNRLVTFRKRSTSGLLSDLLRFAALYGVSFGLSSFLVYANVSWGRMSPMTGKTVAEVLMFLFNYTVMKYWVMPTSSR